MNGDGRLLDRISALAEILSIWSKDYLRDQIDTLPGADLGGEAAGCRT